MKLRETITLSGQPITKPLPKPPDELVELFAKNGFLFNNIGDDTLLLNELYSKDRISIFEKLISKNGLVLKIHHSIWTVYEAKDYKNNPLWILLFPEIWIDEINFQKTCKACNKPSVVVNLERRVPKVASHKPVVTVNGQFTIVKRELKEKIECELSGSRFEPFDDKGEYFYLLSKGSLGELVNGPDDFIEYDGICQECKLPLYKMFYGALKYRKDNWNKDDIVGGDFHEGHFFTEKAYLLIRSMEKEVSKYGVAVLK